MKNLIQKRLKESLDMELIESLLDEDYPTNFDREHFKTLRTFKDRVRYCEVNLQRIAAGSSRIVYKIDNEKVLKLAKNEKGIAQDEVEIQWGNDTYYDDILAQTIDYNQDSLWVEMELARKITKNMFISMVGIPVDVLGRYLVNFAEENKGKRPLFGFDADIKAKLDDNELVSKLKGFMMDADAPAGDFGRLSSYGIVKRDGQDAVVLIDFGLTSDVYSSYYS